MISPLIIMPVKDSVETAERAIRAIIDSGYTLTVYNDNSTEESTNRLRDLSTALGFTLINIGDLSDHPSPNYRFTLIDAQQKTLATDTDLIIIESDVIVNKDTIEGLIQSKVESQKSKVKSRKSKTPHPIGMVAAVTVNEDGEINFPYEYATRYDKGSIDTRKRLSFCCTLLTNELLQAYSFTDLDETKNWYDVFISHKSLELGFHNLLLTDTPVLHMPHSSRPWKLLKYTNPLLYYWRKITRRRDRI